MGKKETVTKLQMMAKNQRSTAVDGSGQTDIVEVLGIGGPVCGVPGAVQGLTMIENCAHCAAQQL